MYRYFFKRFLDIVCSLLTLIVFSPLFLVLIIAGAIEMKGNPFFTQKRPGYNGQIFMLLKFRTMTNEKGENNELLPDELRLNKYGKFLRSTSLDELPEAINILIGDMSVIGPRPLLPRDVQHMSSFQKRRHDVRPGLSGLAQCNGRNHLNWDEKLELDIEYVEKISFVLDVSIILKTVIQVIKHEGVTFDEGAEMDLKDWNELKKQNGVSK